MDTKLTLRLNERVIERAKRYARNHKISLSKMIEVYLDSITKQKDDEKKIAITPLVESLSGVIDLPADFDYKKEYRDYSAKFYPKAAANQVISAAAHDTHISRNR